VDHALCESRDRIKYILAKGLSDILIISIFNSERLLNSPCTYVWCSYSNG